MHIFLVGLVSVSVHWASIRTAESPAPNLDKVGVLLKKLGALGMEPKLHLAWRRIQVGAAAQAQALMLMR